VTVKRLVAAVLLASTPACTRSVVVQPVDYLATHSPKRIAVVDDRGEVYQVLHPAIVDGELVGYEIGKPYAVAVPVEYLRGGLIKQIHPVKTGLLFGAVAVVAAVGIMAMAGGGTGEVCAMNFDVDVEGSSPRGHCATDGPDGGPIPNGGSNTLNR
jgi:hypothetical protein